MNTVKMIKTSMYLLLLSMLTLTLQAQDMSTDELVMKTYRAFKYAGDDGIALANMDIKDANGKVIMNRELLLMKKNVGDGMKQKWYAYFKKPADIRKMVFMVWKNPEQDDDRWLYLPAMDLVKRLAGSDKRSSFAGSQFFYEDVTGRNPLLDEHELVKTTDQFYEVKSTPKNASDVEFSYYYTYIDKANFIPMKRTFYDKNGEAHRVYQSEKVENIQGFPTIVEFSMTNNETGESSYASFSGIKYNVGIDDKLFTQGQIRRTPRKWLKYFRN